jgi:hypothetical protein
MGRAYGVVKIKAYRSFMNNVLQDLINSNSSQARLNSEDEQVGTGSHAARKIRRVLLLLLGKQFSYR